MIGRTIFHYRILSRLGEGGMGEVYLAEDLKHRRQVAIKVLAPEVTAAVGSERFLREIEIAAKLTHPHILPVHDSGSADGLLYYVMPYVEGESLRQRLTREKQLSVEDALRIAREVADALSYAHSRGVVHRDIKPENILMESGHAVVADFGIARAVGQAGGAALTTTGITVGTPAYMSPEQASGSGDLDGRSDLYSLGCVLYEMLAGQPPFTGPTAESLAHQHLNVSPRPVTEIRPAVPAGVAAALQRALAKAPADRFNPVALFGEALGHRETQPVSTPVPALAAAPSRRGRWLALAGLAAVAVVIAVVAAVWIMRSQRKAPAVHGRTDIAVLPFQNLSAEGPNAYFAGGLHEELLTQLAKVAALKVISRTSVMGYVNTTKPLRQIAAELGVGSIVEGSVQVAGNRLRVNVQLIDATTDEHLWAERYDRTLDDAFAIQSDVAQQIVAAVGGALGAEERQSIADAPTANPEAYRLYLRGEEHQRRPGYLRGNLETAQRLYERALALDSTFALAHAALSAVDGQMYWYRYDPAESRAARMRAEAETALRLAPGLPQAHFAMGYAYGWGRQDWRLAQREFQAALKGAPNDARIWASSGYAHRRLGQWNEVFQGFERATRLDPRNADLFSNLGGNTFFVTHRYAEAVQAYDRALNLAPELTGVMVDRAWVFVSWKGQLDTLRTVLARVPREEGLQSRANLLLYERNSDSLLRLVQGARVTFFHGQNFMEPVALYAGWAHQLRGDHTLARSEFEMALALLDSVLKELPDDWRIHAARGHSLAGLGRRQEALREAQYLQQSRAYREDRLTGPTIAAERAMILARAGEAEAALDEIERLLAGPSWTSSHTLRLDPRWDPIREHPRFKALLVKYANPEKFTY